jgi:hypothetical protein
MDNVRVRKMCDVSIFPSLLNLDADIVVLLEASVAFSVLIEDSWLYLIINHDFSSQEMIHLQDQNYPLNDSNGGVCSKKDESLQMPILRIGIGHNIHALDMRNQPNISIGGYFILSQMLGYIHSLISLDLSCNGLQASEARVISLGLRMNKSIMVSAPLHHVPPHCVCMCRPRQFHHTMCCRAELAAPSPPTSPPV